MPGIVGALLAIFKVWMLIDAMQRFGCGRGGCGSFYWYWIILMPFGDVAYFVMFKIHDPEFALLFKRFLEKPEDLQQIRSRAEHNPCAMNKALLAEALTNRGEFKEALGLWEEVLKQDNKDKLALHGAAICRWKLGSAERAEKTFTQLIDLDCCYSDYQPVLELAMLYEERNELDKALTLLGKFSRDRLSVKLKLAGVLVKAGQSQEAITLLERSLAEYQHAPAFAKKREKPLVKEAKALLKACQTERPGPPAQ